MLVGLLLIIIVIMNSDMPSYERINYMLRPNKSVERKMVCEMLSRISAVRNVSMFQYIGFGSTYFADFSLFHRNLGITQMISIEGEGRAKNRCEFNKPFACIDLRMGESSDILPNLDFNTKDSIVWLDYDGIISDTVFSDINTVVTAIRPDSFFMLSLNAEFILLKQEAESDIKQYLIDMIGEERFPNQFLDNEITSKIYLNILYHCIIEEIRTVVQKRNGMEDYELTFHQVVYFVYKDGARMMTIGGFLFKKDEENERMDKMAIHQLPYYRNSMEPFNIKCPVLSLKEIQALNSFLPREIIMDKKGEIKDEDLNNFPVENKDIKQYSFLYRYYPNFAETLL